MMRKITFLLTTMLLYTVGLRAAEMTWHLVTDTDAAIELTKVSYLLASTQETFDIVCTDGTIVSSVKSIKLEKRESSGIQKAKTNGEGIFSQIVDGTLTISNAKAGTIAQVISVSGITCVAQTLTDGQNIINVSQLYQGTYILKVGDTTIKFIKK